jgi:stalled ribosome rescue protein Dom34
MDQAQGLVQFFFLTNVLAKVVLKVQAVLPKNRRFEKANFSKKLAEFYQRIVDGIHSTKIVDMIRQNQIKCVICAGPGFLKSDFLTWVRKDVPTLLRPLTLAQVNQVFFEAHCSTANKQG